MRVYLDSSALIKRAVTETESDALESAITDYTTESALILSSSLAWIEVSRALRSRLQGRSSGERELRDAAEGALSGVAERFITGEVVGLARRVGPPVLRTLGAIHLATAILLDVDRVIAYDERLIAACKQNGLSTASPGR